MTTLHDLPESLNNLIIWTIRSENITLPQILLGSEIIKKNYNVLKNFFNADNKIFYSVKANNHPDVLNMIKGLGAGFEIASEGELKNIEDINADPSSVLFSNPVKIPRHISKAYEYGVRVYAFDTYSELKKISEHAPGSEVFLRIRVPNKGAEWELNDKFGCSLNEVIPLFKKAAGLNLTPAGVTFHVGWNNHDVNTWQKAVSLACKATKMCYDHDISLRFINLGGGFPAHNTDQYDLIRKISVEINPLLSALQKKYNINVYTEPGTFLMANAGVLLTRIFDIAKRNGKNWIFTDTGIFQGFFWIMGGLKYNIIYPYEGYDEKDVREYTVTGPSCDSHDIFSDNALLPSCIKKGDILAVYPAGAYIASAKEYNGFSYPKQILH